MEYLLFNLGVIIFPFLFSFERKYVHFISKWKAFVPAIFLTATFFISWDVLATHRGHWGFNPKYVTGLQITNLPIEEVMFFFTVPFACLFCYEIIQKFVTRHLFTIDVRIFYSIGLLMIMAGIWLWPQEYSAVACISAGAVLLLYSIFERDSLADSNFYNFFLLATILCLVFNNILTSLPVVIYNPEMIENVRIITVPIEDFVYNFSLLGLNLFLYKKFLKW